MNKIKYCITAFFIALLFTSQVHSQNKCVIEQHESGKYKYTTVSNDPLKARWYKLDNGLTVILSENRSEPRIQTFIATKAGSKNDPANATGLAHYLEHMLFKGTNTFGSLDFAKETAELNKIEEMYETYRKTTDPAQRKALYHQIDSVSGVAAKYAIANEYDKMLGSIGAKGTNAFTSFEQTVYVNDVPANQLDKWLTIEAERFRQPVLRLFHTELEAVYEEKNRSLDTDDWKVYEMLFAELFKNHTYGTQTTIGTIEHLKNPSLKEIEAYYEKNYVPNNMAIVLAGDFNSDEVIKQIDQKFSYMKSAPVPQFVYAPEKEITGPIRKEVTGPNAEFLMMGFRLPGANDPDMRPLRILDMILSNSKAGLIDLNLNQAQKVLSAYSALEMMKDYSVHMFNGAPREGQKLEEVEKLLLDQVNMIKRGDFDESILSAIINDIEIQEIRSYEKNNGRAFSMLNAFTSDIPWEKKVNELNELRMVTKKQVMDIANKYYKDNNFVSIYKRTGEDKNVTKVEKPQITAVEVNRESQSDFVKNVLATSAVAMTPNFIDYKKDIQQIPLKSGVPIYYLKNDENQLFTLYYVVDMGKMHDKKMAFAIRYLEYLGTDKLSPEDFKKKLFSIGADFGVSSGEEQSYVYLSGLDKNFKEGVALFEDLLKNAKPDQEALAALVEGELKERADAKLDKNTILQGGLRNYGVYGAYNPFTNILTEAELKALTANELAGKIKELTAYQHHILYYGPRESQLLASDLNIMHNSPASLKPIPTAKPYVHQSSDKNIVYFIDYDMVQAEIMMLSKSIPYSADFTPKVALFNEYFGGNMSSIVFQTIRESKALAYSTYASYSTPQKKDQPFGVVAYVGTQADKIHEAMKGMQELLEDMPKSDKLFPTAKNAIKNRIETERIVRTDKLFNYENARKKGLEYDIRQDVYTQTANMTFDDINKFHQEYIKGKKYNIMILGSKSKIDLKSLEQYGEVKTLTLKDIFGY